MPPKFHIELNRIQPLLPPQHYKTYSARAPLSTHWRPATCEEVDCEDYRYGFVTTIDVGTELGQRQFDFLTKRDKKRSHTRQNVGNGLWKFVYKPGTICMKYQDHRVPIGMPPLLLVVPGDWRGNPMHAPTIRHRSVENWVEDFALHQDRLAETAKRG
jgi:hypothetical protein